MGFKDRYFQHVVEHAAWHVALYWTLIIALSTSVNVVFPLLYPGDELLDKLSDPSSEAQRFFDARSLALELYKNKSSPFMTTFVLQFQTLDSTDVFTPANLQIMCEVEKIIFDESSSSPNCDIREPAPVCISQRSSLLPLGTSVSAVFYSYNSTDPRTFWENSFAGLPLPSIESLPIGQSGFFPHDCSLLEQADVDYVSSNLVGNNQTTVQQLYGFFLAKSTISIGFSPETRSVLQLSSTVSLQSVLERIENKLLVYFSLSGNFFTSVYRSKARRGNLDVIFVEETLAGDSYQDMIPPDIILLISSVTFVFVWMWIVTKSFWVALSGVIGVLSTVTVAEAVYKLVLRIEYFDFVHAIAVLFILGIGADAVFVVYDAWKQSIIVYQDDFSRYKYTVERSSKNVFSSAFTTAASFVGTAITPVVVLSTFGIFCALVILVCLVYTFTVFPSTILLWDQLTRNVPNSEVSPPELSADAEKEGEQLEILTTSKSEEPVQLEDLENSRNYCFKVLYFPFVAICHKQMVFLGLILGGLGAFGLSKVTPLSKPESFFPKDHMVQVFADTANNKWLSGTENENIKVEIFWGLLDVERNIWGWYTGEPSRYGDKLTFDQEFDLSKYSSQTAIRSLCEQLPTLSCGLPECTGGKLVLATLPAICPIIGFQDWWVAQYNNTDYQIENKTESQRAGFYSALRNFSRDLGLEDYIGFHNGKLIYFGTEWRMSVVSFESGETKRKAEELLKELILNYNGNAPKTAQAMFASSEFARSALEAALVDSVGRGLLIAFGLVSVVLLFGTNNVFLAMYTVVTITLIVVTVLGFFFGLLEWELGLAESAITVLTVGFSVDYTVHLGQMYSFAGVQEGFVSREDKFKYAVLTMGPTVIAGGITLIGTAFFLVFGQIGFFLKMALFIFVVISTSLYFAFLFLMPLLYWIGPEGSRGTIVRGKSTY